LFQADFQHRQGRPHHTSLHLASPTIVCMPGTLARPWPAGILAQRMA
jgi:hypothetical protein